MKQRPRILVFTGTGKGKTTAALGMALRAGGHGMRACMIQFVKNDPSTGEIAALEMLETLEIVQTGRGFVPPRDAPAFAEHQAAAETGLAKARETIVSGRYDIVILDEICFAISVGLLAEGDVVKVVKAAPAEMCIVLTGRGATDGLVKLADTVTDMRCVKHAMDDGRTAQKGVER